MGADDGRRLGGIDLTALGETLGNGDAAPEMVLIRLVVAVGVEPGTGGAGAFAACFFLKAVMA